MTSIDVGIDVRPVAGRVGAVVDGVTLAGDLDSRTFSAINRDLLEQDMLFFRGQDNVHLCENRVGCTTHLRVDPGL
ncbi:MAG: hypothetical protein V7607_1693 [Solirubrobacteraceae bacterium]